MPVKDISHTTHTATYPVPKDLAYGQPGLVTCWEVRLWKPGGDSPQSANFSVTGETRVPGRRDVESCGCIHDLLVEFDRRKLLQGKDARVPGLVRWHGWHVDRGAWSYVENSTYWYKRHLRHLNQLVPGVEYWERQRPEAARDDANALDHFKSTIVFGALPDDVIPAIPPMPRAPDATDEFLYEPHVAKKRYRDWVKRCEATVDDALVPWLNGRLPRLMALFEADMVRWFGPEILTTPETPKEAP